MRIHPPRPAKIRRFHTPGIRLFSMWHPKLRRPWPIASSKICHIFPVLLALCLSTFLAGCALWPLTSTPPAATPSPIATPSTAAHPAPLAVHFLDVGQGDSIFIELPDGQTLLIDAGERGCAEGIIAYIKARGHTALDHVIATHPHADHIGGMAKVVDAFEVKNFYMPKVLHTTATFENLLDAVARQGLSIQTARAGKLLLEANGLRAAFLAPTGDTYKNLNNYSAVLLLTYGEKRFLFMGDAEAVSEAEMLAGGAALEADVLKVGHHGSQTSSSEAFLAAVRPDIAVICVGRDNTYGHPTPNVLARLNNVGAEVRRTDAGTVTITCDGQTLWVRQE